ncbi:MAG: hypothetical protein IJ800_00365 [Clostridia bacterium]|nr:hypothetical protein [Clostridia bacterium]
MVKNGKSFRSIVFILALCFMIISMIACSKTAVSDPKSEQPASTSREQSTSGSEEQSDNEGSTESESDESGKQDDENSTDPADHDDDGSQSTKTVNPPSTPVEESTYSAH